MGPEFKLIKSTGFFMEEVDGEWLLFKPTSQKALGLNETASVIWQLCDGSRSAKDVSEELSTIYPDQADTISSDVAETVELLCKEGALMESVATAANNP